MSDRRQIPENIQNQVRQRANCLCEYCHASEQWQYVEFTIEHIIPLTKRGTNDIDNLALACFHCNRQKSNKTFDILQMVIISRSNQTVSPTSAYWLSPKIASASQ